MSEFKHADFIEPAVTPEFFVTDLHKAERFGSFVRLSFGVPDTSVELVAKSVQMISVVKLLLPAGDLAEIIARLGEPADISAPPERRDPPQKPKLVIFEKPSA